MSHDDDHDGNHDGDRLAAPVRVTRERRERWHREGERPMGRNLALIGTLGWLVVVPTLLATALGRWLDRALDAGIFWTVSLIFAGIIYGGWLAWKRIEQER